MHRSEKHDPSYINKRILTHSIVVGFLKRCVIITGVVMNYFTERKSHIEHSLRFFLESQKKDLSQINIWGPDLCDRLCLFASQGKMLRGGLLLLAHDLFGGQNSDDAHRGAAAMELFQSAFLIHDDIMDRDEVRRGQPSLFAQYMKLGNETGMFESRRFGESMGICAGDAAFFWGYALLASISCTGRIADIMPRCRMSRSGIRGHRPRLKIL
jgi:geranylgeranyl pyrophosphate synthase